jgi:hypothetical protein
MNDPAEASAAGVGQYRWSGAGKAGGRRFEQEIEIGGDQADRAITAARQVDQSPVRAEVRIARGLDGARDGVLDIALLELAFEQAEDAIGGNEPADAVDRVELLDPAKQPAGEAFLAGSEEIDDVAAELEEVGQAGTGGGRRRRRRRR